MPAIPTPRFDRFYRHPELTRLLEEYVDLLAVVHLDGGAFELVPDARATGESIARNVHAALGGK